MRENVKKRGTFLKFPTHYFKQIFARGTHDEITLFCFKMKDITPKEGELASTPYV